MRPPMEPLSFSELELKARSQGFLGEHQIQHAKPFKKAKKSLGIRSIRDGFGGDGKWAWSMPQRPAQIAIVTLANSNLDAKEQPSVRDARPPDRPPAESESRGIVQQWIEGVQSLDSIRDGLTRLSASSRSQRIALI